MSIFLPIFLFTFVFISHTFTILRTGDLPKINITIVGTNDIHGGAYPTLISRKDTGERFNYGGLVYMARIIEILKE
jgi:2',3'-cyclic-nucleotide 2'-phosphodiesterase (5'-nucleotidase family)